MEKTNHLERICKSGVQQTISTLDDIRNTISALNGAKKAMLESSVYALQEGEALLDKLNQLWIQSSSDQRTDFKKESISLAIEQVSLCNKHTISEN